MDQIMTQDSDQVLYLIEHIAVTAGKNEKQALLKAGDSPLLRQVLQAALEPTWTYGIVKLPERCASGGDGCFDTATWGLIEAMRTRNLTGKVMQNALASEMERLSVFSAELLGRILTKDLRAGFADNTSNKAFPGLISDYPYMRCCLTTDTDLTKWPWEDGVIVQEKADGMFFNVNHEEDVRLSSRAGSAFDSAPFAFMVEDIKAAFPRGTQTHGEVVVYKDGLRLSREAGNGILNSVLAGGAFGTGETPVLLAWDQIPMSVVVPKGRYNVPYRQRLATLVKQIQQAHIGRVALQVRIIPTNVVKSLAEAYALYFKYLKENKEGIVVCHPEEDWRDGNSKGKVKLKLEFVVDLVVKAIMPGKAGKKNANRAGSLRCETSDGRLQVDVTVKNDAMRDDVDANPDNWVGRIIKVKATGVMRPSASNKLHSMFLPRMVEACYRIDKHEADSLERVFEQQEAAKQAAIIGKS